MPKICTEVQEQAKESKKKKTEDGERYMTYLSRQKSSKYVEKGEEGSIRYSFEGRETLEPRFEDKEKDLERALDHHAIAKLNTPTH